MNSTGSACEVHYPLIPNGYLARQHSYNGEQQEVPHRGAIVRRASSLKPDVPPKPLFIPATSPVNEQGKYNYWGGALPDWRGSVPHRVNFKELLSEDMQRVRGCWPLPENTTNCVAASVTVDKSLNQTCFSASFCPTNIFVPYWYCSATCLL